MFGTFRYILAAMVVVTHLGPGAQLAWGVYGVWAFFVVSGYLMALILDRTYPFDGRGLARYGANRALRIYPAYVVVCVATVLLLALLPDAAAIMNPKLRWHEGIVEWLSSFLIFGQLGASRALVPPAWSLQIELVFYLLMAFGLARGRSAITLWFAASVLYTGYLLATQASLPIRYGSIGAASLPFSCGALAYTWRDRLPRISAAVASSACVLFVVNAAVASLHPLASIWGGHFYGSLVFAFCCVASLARLEMPRSAAAWDRKLGDLSYPIFLAHYAVAVALCAIARQGDKPESIVFLVMAFALTNGVAWALDRVVDQPLAGVRDRLRATPPQRGSIV